jgi:hypothetical protein
MPNWFIALPVAGAGWFERVPATPVTGSPRDLT